VSEPAPNRLSWGQKLHAVLALSPPHGCAPSRVDGAEFLTLARGVDYTSTLP